MNLPIAIRLARARLGLSQTDLARVLGISAATVRNWEQSRNQPTGLARVALVRWLASMIGKGGDAE